MKYVEKTKSLDHQVAYRKRVARAKFFALLSEQGTGKTKSLIDEAGDLFAAGLIDGLLVVAPNDGDIPANWLDQVAAHLHDKYRRQCLRVKASKMKKADKEHLAHLSGKGLGLHVSWKGGPLQIITTNYEAIRSGSDVFKALLGWMRRARVMMVCDEATRISSPNAAQSRAAHKLGMNAVYKRISTGTLTAGGPFNAYSPMTFLAPNGEILGTDSYTAFKAEHCEMLPPEHGLVRYTAGKMAGNIRDPRMKEQFQKKMQSIIQLPKRDADEQVIYKNIPELNAKIAAHSFRVLKDECLDLPPKIYMPMLYVDLTPKQKEIYDQVQNEVIAEFVHERELRQITVDMAIKRLLRLQQIVCNHYTPDPDVDEPRIAPRFIERWEDTPRIRALLGVINDAGPDARLIIWCRFHPEIRQINDALHDQFAKWGTVVEYHGKMNKVAQVESRKRFLDRSSNVRYLIGQVRAGIGVDMYSAWGEFFYSNDWSLENRLQAEDRGHRIGLTNKLPIWDIMARGAKVDERLVNALRNHHDIHRLIMGDQFKQWIQP